MTSKEVLLEKLKKLKVLKSPEVVKAFERVERREFVAPEYKSHAYFDEPLPLFSGQTISQPYTVAVMTEALELHRSQKVLEVGTGSGYQAAIISEIIGERGQLFTIERIKRLVDFAKRNLKNYKNITLVHGDGSKGLPDKALFDRIIVTAAAGKFPNVLFNQLHENGILVTPTQDNKLLQIRKKKNQPVIKNLGAFVFVPLVED